jgi:hypothetical protein
MFSTEPLFAGDLRRIDRQPSQAVTLGLPAELSDEEIDALVASPESWACFDDERLIGCVGIHEQFEGAQGVAWAILASGIGTAHLALTRFAASRIAASPLARIEAIAIAADAEPIVAQFGCLDMGQLIAAIMADPTPECRWAELVGLRPAAVLRRYGAMSQTHMLFERIGDG